MFYVALTEKNYLKTLKQLILLQFQLILRPSQRSNHSTKYQCFSLPATTYLLLTPGWLVWLVVEGVAGVGVVREHVDPHLRQQLLPLVLLQLLPPPLLPVLGPVLGAVLGPVLGAVLGGNILVLDEVDNLVHRHLKEYVQ